MGNRFGKRHWRFSRQWQVSDVPSLSTRRLAHRYCALMCPSNSAVRTRFLCSTPPPSPSLLHSQSSARARAHTHTNKSGTGHRHRHNKAVHCVPGSWDQGGNPENTDISQTMSLSSTRIDQSVLAANCFPSKQTSSHESE